MRAPGTLLNSTFPGAGWAQRDPADPPASPGGGLTDAEALKIRGFGMGVSVFLLWIVNFGISQVFPTVREKYRAHPAA